MANNGGMGIGAPSGPSRAAPLDAPSRPSATSSLPSKIQQPKPQALPSRGQSSAILINTRQKGNPVIANIRAVPWEWAETPADYVLGATTCALFLSLKYHRLHPEYIYTRIKELHGQYGLRIILTMVDITNHEESLKELSKTSLINNVTLILCWSAQEAGHYLELFKSYENAAPTSIKAHQSSSYSDRLVDFITVPRSVNKTDAVSLVSTFGSLRTAVNAQPEEIALVAGWGGKKVQRWTGSVRDPFRVKKAARRGLLRGESSVATLSRDASRPDVASRDARSPIVRDDSQAKTAVPSVQATQPASEAQTGLQNAEETRPVGAQPPKSNRPKEAELSEGIAAALERLRNKS